MTAERHSTRDRARRVISDAREQHAAIYDQTKDRILDQTESELLEALRNGRVVTAWWRAHSLPLSDDVRQAARDLAHSSPMTFAAELCSCDPFTARSLVPRPESLEDLGAVARCISASHAPWIAGLFLHSCLRFLEQQHPRFIQVGGDPKVSQEGASDLLIEALLRSNFQASMYVGLDILTSQVSMFRLEQTCGTRFESMCMTAAHLVARHPPGVEVLRSRVAESTSNEPPLSLLLVASRTGEATGTTLHKEFLEHITRFFEDDRCLPIFHTAATLRGRLLVKAMIQPVLVDLVHGADWWLARWKTSERTFTSWPDRRSFRDPDRLLTLLALAVTACHELSKRDPKHAEEVAAGVLDPVLPFIPRLLLLVSPREVSTRTCVQLLVRGFVFMTKREDIGKTATQIMEDFFRCLRTNELVEDAIMAAETLGATDMKSRLEGLRTGLVKYEADLLDGVN